ncbi:hypothetical protein OGAPHI_000921 [Ogataea philodendri]|uniref:PCI domain-containing protein n=1 Tax=Ogataea philodendri TaxID=1378263 RepID=A0A9P8PEJ1_9ASCO|nr:uncharacterized protein OGAPHI_000921 [Ogataea philodendri]KAH3670406.1 hypothetical protein OGAPHI_000921 [Ogataea philodendri]
MRNTYSLQFNEYGDVWRQNPTAVSELFAFGTVSDYMNNKALLGELTDHQLLKLRQLTLMSLARQKTLSFDTVAEQLACSDVVRTLALLARTPLLELEIDELAGQVTVKKASPRDIWVHGDPKTTFTKPLKINDLLKELNYDTETATSTLKRRLES